MIRNIRIAFDGQMVSVHSDAPEVVLGLQKRFGLLVTPDVFYVVRTIEVVKCGLGYYTITPHEGGAKFILDEVLDRVSGDVIDQLFREREHLLVIHAAAVARSGYAVLMPGPSGRGKSSLSVGLYNKGWSFLADEIAPFDMRSNKVLPFPQTPFVRYGNGTNVSWLHLGEIKKEPIALVSEGVAREPCMVGALIFPVYESLSQTKLIPCSPGIAAGELLSNSGVPAGVRQDAIQNICRLAEAVPAFRLIYSSPENAVAVIARAEQAGLLQPGGIEEK